MFSALCLLASSAILFYVLKYRVHVHVTYTPTSSRKQVARKGRRVEADGRLWADGSSSVPATATEPNAKTRPVSEFVPVASTSPERSGPIACDPSATRAARLSDLQSALVNLGAKKDRARRAAEHVLRNWPDLDFDAQIRAAVNEVQAA